VKWKGWEARDPDNSHLPENGHLYAEWLFSQREDWLRSQGIEPPQGIESRERWNPDDLRDLFDDNKLSVVKELYGGILVPGFMRNKPDLSSQSDIVGKLPFLKPGTVIVGVLDTGIALGHRSTRLSDGKTRFIAAWQQSAGYKVSGEEFPDQDHLPFGRELFTDDINELLETHSVGGLKGGWLDEEAFNRAAGLVDFYNPLGHRELARRAAHGTHVLGRAAGFDIAQHPALTDFADKIRIIAINLPARDIVGLSGSFLEQYVGLGIARIVKLERLLVERARQETEIVSEDDLEFHYPLIINLSFGKQAGPRDGEEPIAKSISRINEDTRSIVPVDQGGIFFTVPAGNDNLLQGNATATLTVGEERGLKWRVLPEDQTPNYVEIWSEPIEGDLPDGEPVPLQVSIDLPNGVAWSSLHGGRLREVLSTRDGDIDEIEHVARVYCKIKNITLERSSDNELVNHYRIHFLICAAPTLDQGGALPTAPAGVWKVRLANRHSSDLKIYANVQTDQSAVPDGVTGLRSYFEDENYVRVDETTGRSLDTYPYPYDEKSALERENLGLRYLGHDKEVSTVKRHGTLNALAIDRNYSVVVGGYRATDGASAIYSATGGDRIGRYMGAPTLALVTDDGPAHPGILSEGARDGSAVAMRGTSFAAPQITKKIAELLVDGETDLNPKTWINAQSKPTYADGEISQNERKYPQGIDIEKGGRGRFPQAHHRGLNRLGLEEADD